MIQENNTQKIKTLIILLNMGGPQNKDEIHPYLKELFQDRELLKLPMQKILEDLSHGEELQKFRSDMKKLVSIPLRKGLWMNNVPKFQNLMSLVLNLHHIYVYLDSDIAHLGPAK